MKTLPSPRSPREIARRNSSRGPESSFPSVRRAWREHFLNQALHLREAAQQLLRIGNSQRNQTEGE